MGRRLDRRHPGPQPDGPVRAHAGGHRAWRRDPHAPLRKAVPMSSSLAIGIDIGGTGIKGSIVDLDKGELVTERVKVATPDGGEPNDIVDVVVKMIDGFGSAAKGLPVGVCFPAIILDGRTMSAANVSKKWVGLE